MKKYDIIIWDVDGTLLDTSNGIFASARYIIQQRGFSIPAPQILATYIGPPIQKSFFDTLPVSVEEAHDMAEAFREHYKKYSLYKAHVYPEMSELLSLIKNNGMLQAVATYKREDYAEDLLRYFNLSDYMECICGSDYNGKLSKTDIIKKAMNQIAKDSSLNVVMIGDSMNDLKGAEDLGIDFIGVTYGFGFEKKLSGIKMADNISDLKNFLLKKGECVGNK